MATATTERRGGAPKASSRLELSPGVVHVLEARLDVSSARQAAARSELSALERARADRFAHARHRRRYTVAQSLLRRALGRFVGKAPTEIRFRRGPRGKPFLEGGPSFNLSHSGERAIVAVTRSGRLGVDVEETRAVRWMLRIAERRFAPDERRRLLDAPEGKRTETFLRLWTAKEALAKALGVGLGVPFRSFSIDPAAGAAGRPTRSALTRSGDLGEDETEWTVAHLPGAADRVAAFALDRPGATLRRLARGWEGG